MEAPGETPKLLYTSEVAALIGKSRKYIINLLGRCEELMPGKNPVGHYVWTPEQIKALEQHISTGRRGKHRSKPA